MKTKPFLIFTLIFINYFIGVFGSPVLGTDYSSDYNINDEVVWTVTIDDEQGQADVGLSINGSVGDRTKILVKDKGISGGIIWIKIDAWNWIESGQEFKDEADQINFICGWNSTPASISNIECIYFIPFNADVKLIENAYLMNLNNSNSFKVDINNYIEIVENKTTYNIKYMYDTTTGYLVKVRYLKPTDVIIFEYYSKGLITDYLLLLVILSLIPIIGIVFIILVKMKGKRK